MRSGAGVIAGLAASLLISAAGLLSAQTNGQASAAVSLNGPPGISLPPDYVIGPDDLLSVVFWREAEMSGQVRVRPDGKISLPLLKDVTASGLTPNQLSGQLEQDAKRYMTEPNATVVVLEVNSRMVFVIGQVARPGVYPLNTPMNVLQAIAAAGGLLEFADDKGIIVDRVAGASKVRLPFNYRDVIGGKKAGQNVLLRPGDTVIVP